MKTSELLILALIGVGAYLLLNKSGTTTTTQPTTPGTPSTGTGTIGGIITSAGSVLGTLYGDLEGSTTTTSS